MPVMLVGNTYIDVAAHAYASNLDMVRNLHALNAWGVNFTRYLQEEGPHFQVSTASPGGRAGRKNCCFPKLAQIAPIGADSGQQSADVGPD